MKTIIALIIIIFLTLTASGQKKWREIDLRINGVGSGTSHAVVRRKIGKPLRSKTEKLSASEACSNSAETYLTLFYSGMEITLLGDGKGRNLNVVRIEATSPKWIASGVRIGADASDVLTKFGEPVTKEEKSGETIFYYVTKDNLGGVSFHFRDNKLVKIIMSEVLC